jgi:ABC-type dipeptide/oligopeptide/nickel transport system ATPase subunit
VLDKEGEKNTYLFIEYDKDMKVAINQALIYDASGKVFRKIKQSEIMDYPYSDYALFWIIV